MDGQVSEAVAGRVDEVAEVGEDGSSQLLHGAGYLLALQLQHFH